MFLRITHSRGRAYLSIAQSFRDNGRTVHEIVLNLGPRDELSAGQIRELAVAASDGDSGLLRYVYRNKNGTPGSENPGVHLAKNQGTEVSGPR